MNAGEVLKTARLNKGLSQSDLAQLCGVTETEIAQVESCAVNPTIDRLDVWLRPTRFALTLVPSNFGAVWQHALAIAHELDEGEWRYAFRQLIQLNDVLTAADHATRVALSITPPAPTGDLKFDALIAGLVEYRLDNDYLPKPLWLEEHRFFLHEPWDLEDLPALVEEGRVNTAPQFSRRNVFINVINFASV